MQRRERHSVLILSMTEFTDRSVPLKPVQRLRVTARIDGGPAFTVTLPIELKDKPEELAREIAQRWFKMPKPPPIVGKEVFVEI